MDEYMPSSLFKHHWYTRHCFRGPNALIFSSKRNSKVLSLLGEFGKSSINDWMTSCQSRSLVVITKTVSLHVQSWVQHDCPVGGGGLLIPNIWMIKLFTNRENIRITNSKYTDLDWYYFWLYGKLKQRVRHLLFMTFMKKTLYSKVQSIIG